MRIVIAGGTGLIGAALVAGLARDGHEVVVLTRSPRPGALPAGARAVAWDARSPGPWAAEVDGADAVVQLAGDNISEGRWTAAKKQRLRDSRVLSGQALAAACERARKRPALLVQGSATGYYGPRGDEEVSEADPPGDDFLARLCVEWEASTESVEGLGMRRAIVRTGVVLTPDGGALAKLLTPFRLGAGGPVGNGRQWFPWIHLADEVAAIRFLLDHRRPVGPWNLTAPQPVRNAELARDLGAALHRPAIVPAPAFALRLAFGEMADVLLTGQRVVPKRLLEDGFVFRFPSLPAALADLLGGG